jgi:hypothetical protein
MEITEISFRKPQEMFTRTLLCEKSIGPFKAEKRYEHLCIMKMSGKNETRLIVFHRGDSELTYCFNDAHELTEHFKHMVL